jgi:hypothetical protein
MLTGRPLSERGPPLFIPVPYGLTLMEGWVPLLSTAARRRPKVDATDYANIDIIYLKIYWKTYNLDILSLFMSFFCSARLRLSRRSQVFCHRLSRCTFEIIRHAIVSLSFSFFPLARSLPGQVTTQFV